MVHDPPTLYSKVLRSSTNQTFANHIPGPVYAKYGLSNGQCAVVPDAEKVAQGVDGPRKKLSLQVSSVADSPVWKHVGKEEHGQHDISDGDFEPLVLFFVAVSLVRRQKRDVQVTAQNNGEVQPKQLIDFQPEEATA